jgi:hypothetical protein
VFTTASNLRITCSDGSTSNKALTDDYVEVASGTLSDLTADYYCNWNLTLKADFTQATILAGQSCATTSTDQTVFTWHGDKFVFSTSDSVTAHLDAELSSEYVEMAGATGTCSIKITGTLTHL